MNKEKKAEEGHHQQRISRDAMGGKEKKKVERK